MLRALRDSRRHVLRHALSIGLLGGATGGNKRQRHGRGDGGRTGCSHQALQFGATEILVAWRSPAVLAPASCPDNRFRTESRTYPEAVRPHPRSALAHWIGTANTGVGDRPVGKDQELAGGRRRF